MIERHGSEEPAIYFWVVDTAILRGQPLVQRQKEVTERVCRIAGEALEMHVAKL